jgi:hypothetical protein
MKRFNPSAHSSVTRMDVQSLVYFESKVPPYSVGVTSDFIQAGCDWSIGQTEEILEQTHGRPRDQVNLDESTGHLVSIYSFLAVRGTYGLTRRISRITASTFDALLRLKCSRKASPGVWSKLYARPASATSSATPVCVLALTEWAQVTGSEGDAEI